MTHPQAEAELRRRAMIAVLAFGMVSLLADIVYEGGRSIIGPYLETIGAGAAAVGLVSGLGEFVGYALRSLTGIFADRTKRYWAMTIGGYALTVVAVPLLGLVGRVDLALALVVAERLGKAVRSPARDTLLAEAAEPLGRGWGFGIHEALDQTGAVAGPLLLALILAARDGDYRFAFGILAIPGILVLAALFIARRTVPEDDPPAIITGTPQPSSGADGRTRRYLAFVFLGTLGLAPFPVVAFHLTSAGVANDAQIPLMFAVAMAVDAAVALVSGRAYDRRGLMVLRLLPVVSALAVLSFAGSLIYAWVGVALWGAAIGVQESTLRAAVADLTPSHARATAYGIFNTVYGFGLLAAGVVLGGLYEVSVPGLVAVVVAAQTGAAVALAPLIRRS